MWPVLYLLMLTFGMCRGDKNCPDMCLCTHYPRESLPQSYLYFTSVSCKSYSGNVTFENTTRLIEVTDLSQDSFDELITSLVEQDLPFLNQLIIKHSEFGGNVSLVLDGLENISFLSLNHDNLENVPEVFSNDTTSTLNSVDFSSNNITLIQHTSFRTLHALEVLNLSDNSINDINIDSFCALTNLKYLDLSKNNLTHLQDNVLLPLSSLQYLNLSNNHIEVLNELCFSNLVMLRQLDVSWNRLAKVAPGSLQLPSLARLLLAGNPNLGRSREVLVSTGGRLQTVDASRTGLRQVPAALTHSIRTLRLAGNSITALTCGELDSYPLLQLLDFTANAIASIEDDALGRLDSLSVLHLTDNEIHEIPKSLPEKLAVLHLERNNVEKVSRDDLLGLRDLEVLLLSDNNIKLVEEDAFAHLIALVTLDLSRNPLSALAPNSLSGPRALQVLRLSLIGSVSPAQDTSFPLSATEHLISLDLSASAGLTRQFLADTAALAASRFLQELDISNTNLDFLRSDLLFYLPQLRMLRVKGNRLNCKDLYWLATWMRRQDEQEYRDIVCNSPAELFGTAVVDLQENNIEISAMQSINQRRVDSKTTINLTKETVTVSKNVDLTTKSRSTAGDVRRYPKTTFIFNLVNPVNKSSVIISEKSIKNKSNDETHRSKFVEVGNSNNVTNDVNQTKTYFPSKMANFHRLHSDRTMLKFKYSTASENSVYNNETYLESLGHLKLSSANESLKYNSTTTATGDSLPSGKNSSNNSNEESFNATMDSTDWIPGDETFTIDPVMTEDTSQWNASTGEMSMYTNTEPKEKLLHPGMLILAAGGLIVVAILAVLATRFNKQKRNNLFEEDIEVSSIPSVTELW